MVPCRKSIRLTTRARVPHTIPAPNCYFRCAVIVYVTQQELRGLQMAGSQWLSVWLTTAYPFASYSGSDGIWRGVWRRGDN